MFDFDIEKFRLTIYQMVEDDRNRILDLEERVKALEEENELINQEMAEMKLKAPASRQSYDAQNETIEQYIEKMYNKTKSKKEQTLGIKIHLNAKPVISKALGDNLFVAQFDKWKKGDPDARPTIFFNGGTNIENVSFGSVGQYKRKFGSN